MNPENQINSHNGLKILVAEDDETSQMLIKMTLRQYSRELLMANTGEQAVEICHNNPDIDLILMDMKMPVMDGYEATLKIREFNRDVIIIAQTAHALWGDREKTLDAGCTDYLTKPINPDDLKSVMQKYFNQDQR
jgi:CheY-like chemotaxis protein